MSESLFVLLQLPRHHLSCSEVETSQVHCVSKVTGQLRLTPELLPRRTKGRGEAVEGQINKYSMMKNIIFIWDIIAFLKSWLKSSSYDSCFVFFFFSFLCLQCWSLHLKRKTLESELCKSMYFANLVYLNNFQIQLDMNKMLLHTVSVVKSLT